ncbi:malate synthase G [Desulfopila sp. IMCC35008]|uniref:malate synthase G n=1 Tax=Desulfopila sp. IMCC35008 TaxID=2653858 RepID=UPI0013D5892A|nr:malate synthase G [Desulfopila sp. IMCC35008]
MTHSERIQQGRLNIAGSLHKLIEQEIAPGTGLDPKQFWLGLETLVAELQQENRLLIRKRDSLQAQIDSYHKDRFDQPYDPAAYKQFLLDIGYIVEEGDDFTISTRNVDSEISTIAGPQLVVPVTNSRYAVNAVNGRWGSLYDALYGTDVIAEADGAEKGHSYNSIRGEKVVAYGVDFLDSAIPLVKGSHAEATTYRVVKSGERDVLEVELSNGSVTGLQDKDQLVGYRGENAPHVLLFCKNGLHLELQIDRKHIVGSRSPGGIKDIILEAALTTICDCEDSVAAVDGDDKALTYRNWLGLIKGELKAEFIKAGEIVRRELNPDRSYQSVDGRQLTLPGRSLMLIRNVGHLMTTDAVFYDGEEIPEGMLDTMVTGYIGLHQIRGKVRYTNGQYGSIYIVKPKMHGPEEVAFACRIFERAEKLLGIAPNTLKMGIMDEERRTSVNLKECIRMARERIIFINTGFLDRTGDEIHTSMEAGPMVCKEDMKNSRWIRAYEDRNVDIGLSTGFSGRAQIGKGMWAKPDMMGEMVQEKIGHPRSGANCAWVPSPTAATLHAMHYHQVDVFAVQKELAENGPRASIDELLTIPLQNKELTKEEIARDLENNAQSILGYVVRWVDQGIGCSKVPNISNVGLMEDRATLRISSQYLANWIRHGICTKEQVLEALQRMALVVDNQNSADPSYLPMAQDFSISVSFQAACDLVFKGCEQSSGYTEPVLHKSRREVKDKTRK